MPTTNTKPITAGELAAALTTLPPHTPVRCCVTIEANLHEVSGDNASFQGMANVTRVRTELNAVVLEVEE